MASSCNKHPEVTMDYLPHIGWFCDQCEIEAGNSILNGYAVKPIDSIRCGDCGERGEMTGHMTCMYPQNH